MGNGGGRNKNRIEQLIPACPSPAAPSLFCPVLPSELRQVGSTRCNYAWLLGLLYTGHDRLVGAKPRKIALEVFPTCEKEAPARTIAHCDLASVHQYGGHCCHDHHDRCDDERCRSEAGQRLWLLDPRVGRAWRDCHSDGAAFLQARCHDTICFVVHQYAYAR
jgi:hypothetical protein